MSGAPPKRSHLDQSGAAIVSALLVVALAAAMVTGLTLQISRWVDSLSQERDSMQVHQLQRAALEWTATILEQDAGTNAIDHLQEAWAQPLPTVSLEQDGELSGNMADATARFNLNNLLDDQGRVASAWVALYRRWLKQKGLPESLADTLVAWMAAADTTTDAPDRLRPSHARLLQMGELAALPGYSPAVMAKLMPETVVLPGTTTVNANTASADLLGVLAGDAAAGPALVSERAIRPFRDKADLAERMAKLGVNIPPDYLDVASAWFLVHGHLRYRGMVRHVDALMQRRLSRTRLVWWTGQ